MSNNAEILNFREYTIKLYGKKLNIRIKRVEKEKSCPIETNAESSCGCVDGRDVEYIISVQPEGKKNQTEKREITEFALAGGSHGLAQIIKELKIVEGDANIFVAKALEKFGFIPNTHTSEHGLEKINTNPENFFDGRYSDEEAEKKLAQILTDIPDCGWNEGFKLMYDGKDPEQEFIKTLIENEIEFIVPVLGGDHKEDGVVFQKRTIGSGYDVTKFVVGIKELAFVQFLINAFNAENVTIIQNALMADAIFTAVRLTRKNIAGIPENENDERYQFIKRIIKSAGEEKGEENWEKLRKIREEIVRNEENINWIEQNQP